MIMQTREMVADDIIAAMYAEETARRDARFVLGLKATHLPEPHATVYQAICDTDDAGEPIHDTTVLARCKNPVTVEWLSQRIALYDALRGGQVFRANVKMAIEDGLRVGTQKLLAIANERLAAGDSREETVSRLITVLSGLPSGSAISNETAATHGQIYRQRLNQSQSTMRPTGLGWLDEMTGGYEQAHLWWIVAAYKQRKTSLMLNMLLASAVIGERPALLSGEMTQEQVYWQLVAMLAVTHLWKSGLYDQKWKTQSGKEVPLNWLSGTTLKKSGDNYKRWHPAKVKAIDWALDVYETLNIRIYDSRDEGGGLQDLDSIQRVVKYDLRRHGGRVYFGDYVQLFEAPGDNMVAKEAAKARAIQRLTRTHNITMIWAAQQNEATVKGNETNDDYSPGVSGGGAVPQTADFLLITKYKRKKDGVVQPDTLLDVDMKLSRHGSTGSNAFDIHPGSGLLIGQSWMEGLAA